MLSNAIKFGLGKPIELSASESGGRARLSVRDQGIGIDPVARERIFLPFERNVSVRHYGGLGLGLHIVKTIVDAMGGRVSVEGEPGAGSTFVVELPLRLSEVADAHPRH
jgi:signal transduction histidine kinase